MRVAVFGAGYAGLTVARRLERQLSDDVEIVVVDESDSHLLQHELHRVIRRPSLAETITVPLSDALERSQIKHARVVDIDIEGNVATLDVDGATERLDYDFAAVCLGSETTFYDIDGLEAYATPLKRLEDADAIRKETVAADGGRVVVGGAGLSGIQVAGELAELRDEEGIDIDISLVEMADRIAPGFDSVFTAAIEDELTARNVGIETGRTVESVDETSVSFEGGDSMDYDAFVWTGGIRGPESLGGERINAESDLRVTESTFVVGDAGSIIDAEGTDVPASAQTAIRQARIAARNIHRLINHRTVDDEADEEPRLYSYEFDPTGWVVSVGDGAVARVGPLILTGEPARAAKATIGVGHLASVGAISQSSELVREELGWPAAGVVDLSPYIEAIGGESHIAAVAADELQDSFAGFVAIADDLSPGEPVDLTPVTRLLDCAYPGGPAGHFERLVSSSVGIAVDLTEVTVPASNERPEE